MSVNGTLVEAKMCTFTLESTHFIFRKCPIYTHDGANAKFSTDSQETDYSVVKKEDFSGQISVLSDANTANTTKDYLSAACISLHTVG